MASQTVQHLHDPLAHSRNWKSIDTPNIPSDRLVWALHMDHGDKIKEAEAGPMREASNTSRCGSRKRRTIQTRTSSLMDDDEYDSEEDSTLVLASGLRNMFLGGKGNDCVVFDHLPGPNSPDGGCCCGGGHVGEDTCVGDSVKDEDIPDMIPLERMDSLDSLVIHRQRMRHKTVRRQERQQLRTASQRKAQHHSTE